MLEFATQNTITNRAGEERAGVGRMGRIRY